MPLQTITDHHKNLVAGALSRAASSDEYEWDLILTMTPQGPAFMVFVTMPSPILGEKLLNIAGFPLAVDFNMENADELARGLFEMLRTQRTETLTKMMSDKPDLSVFTGQKP